MANPRAKLRSPAEPPRAASAASKITARSNVQAALAARSESDAMARPLLAAIAIVEAAQTIQNQRRDRVAAPRTPAAVPLARAKTRHSSEWEICKNGPSWPRIRSGPTHSSQFDP